MVAIGVFCIDRYEAYVVELDAQGREHPHSPLAPVDYLTVRAKVAAGVVPQGYISQKQSAKACESAGKRLCSRDEFERACRGPDAANDYPYGGTERRPGYCNEGKGSSVARFFGPDFSKRTYAEFNDPRLSSWPGSLAKTGAHARCVSPDGVFDLVGNLHEWGRDAADERGRARFRGGFYGDAEVNGHGCAYVTKAHEPTYHDYSTRFRCCVDGRAASIGQP
jgi:formylglycine-generating enzyme required for sulfatase activity